MAKIEIALVYTDGRKEVVSVGRPADLIAFADKFDKVAPDGPRMIFEAAWLTHRAKRLSMPLEDWIDSLDDIAANDEAVAQMQEELAAENPPADSEQGVNGDQATTNAIESHASA